MNQGSIKFSLKANCKTRLKELFITLRKNNPAIRSYILVVDEKTLKIVSAYLKMAELLEVGVTAIENLHLKRKPFKIDAIYFITPTMESLKNLVEDFSDPINPQYKQAHVFFNNNVNDQFLNKMKAQKNLLDKIKTFKVLNLDFSCSNDNLFSLEMPNQLSIYSGKQSTLLDIADKLCTTLISFEKFYQFDILYRNDELGLCETVGLSIQKRLHELLKALQKSKNECYDNVENTCGVVKVIIIDRAIDPLTPLLHDFFYQPMIYDLLNIENDIAEFEGEVQGRKIEKKAVLNDQDELFRTYKYKHIAEVLEGIPLEFKNFIQNNTTAKVQTGQLQNLDLKKMSEIVRGMPQYNELLNKYTLHMSLIEKSWGVFERKDLKEIGDIEQTLATGIDNAGKSFSASKLLSTIATKLLNSQLDEMDKLRLVLCALISLNVSEKDRKTLTDQIRPEDQAAVHNLRYLGVTPQSNKSKSKNRVNDAVKNVAKNKMSSATMDLCRTTPVIEQFLVELIQCDYKHSSFGEIKINDDQQSSQGQGKSLRKKGKMAYLMQNENDGESINQAPKQIIFIIGGIGYNEVRSILTNSQISQNTITILGGTSLLKPNDYAQDLIKLAQVY